MLSNQGIPTDQIGIFYITPCAAKIAAIKGFGQNTNDMINGVINMSYISNKLYHKIKNRKDSLKDLPVLPHLSSKAS